MLFCFSNKGEKDMIRKLIAAGAFALGLMSASGAMAEPYVDYTPEKGVWDISAIEVDLNHVDDYLAGLRKTQIPVFEILKNHGIIDDYKIVVRNGYVKGSPSVLIETHYPSYAMLAPDKARDQMIQKEIYAKMSKSEGDKAVAGYEKYRTFIDDGLWNEATFTK
jgi:hypothetical protein